MGERDRQQSVGLEILKLEDPTFWKQALKSELGRKAKKRKVISGRRGLLSGILDRLKRPRE